MKKISPKLIEKTIEQEAYKIKRKKEIYETVKNLNKELQVLEENFGMAGTFGFKSPTDITNKTKSGFVDDHFQNISNIIRLEKELGTEEKRETLSEDVLDEVAQLKKEIEMLKQENQKLKGDTK